MRRYRFDSSVGQPLSVFDSVGFTFSKILRQNQAAADFRIACAHLQPGGVIGHHPATMPQLLIVVQGQGTVRGAEEVSVTVQMGEMVLWLAGEWHETRTENGLMALIVESAALRVEDVLAVPLD